MKTPQEQKLVTRQVSRRLENSRPFAKSTEGIISWIDYIRLGLGMSLVQLARRVGVTQATLSSSIKLEREGRITLKKLSEIANAMDCDLVYALVPRKKIEDMIIEQAMKKTGELMDESDTHMSLEDQKVKLNRKDRQIELAEERMFSKYLWD